MLFGLLCALAVTLLVIEWRTRSRAVRVITVAGALTLYALSHPDIHDALFDMRSQMPAEPILSRLTLGTPERAWYMTGVLTLHRRIDDEVWSTRPRRWLALGALLWLAVLPSFRHPRRESPLDDRPVGAT
jgi:hypothetical protein